MTTVARRLTRRLGFALLLVFVVSSGAFLLTRAAPGDFASELYGAGATAESIARERARMGLDRSVAAQYADWLSHAARLDLGTSLMYRRPVADLVGRRAANTALLALVALTASTLVGLPLGVVSGSTRRRTVAGAARLASTLALSMPPLVTSLVLVLVAARTGWFPIGGMSSAFAPEAWGPWLGDLVWHLALPSLALALPMAATFERMQSQAMRETLAEPYIRAAEAKGLSRRRIVWRAALLPSLKPVASIYGLVLASLLSGSFAVEIVTSWPGLGRLMFDALRARDVPLVAGCAIAGAIFLAVGSLVSDVALLAVEPRLRTSEARALPRDRPGPRLPTVVAP